MQAVDLIRGRVVRTERLELSTAIFDRIVAHLQTLAHRAKQRLTDAAVLVGRRGSVWRGARARPFLGHLFHGSFGGAA
jgi:hypothetical protein